MSSASGRSKRNSRRTGVIAIGAAVVAIGYAAATHWAVASGHAGTLSAGLLLAPALAGLGWLAARPPRPVWIRLAAAAAFLALVMLAARGATGALSVLYPLPSLLVYCALLWMFARTLAPGREALVTALARHVHGTLPDEITAYTRQVNWAWCLFFGAMALTSLLLFALAPLALWSLFVNVLSLPLIAAMFVAEYAYRVLRYRRFSHAPFIASLWAFRELGRSAVSPGRGG